MSVMKQLYGQSYKNGMIVILTMDLYMLIGGKILMLLSGKGETDDQVSY